MAMIALRKQGHEEVREHEGEGCGAYMGHRPVGARVRRKNEARHVWRRHDGHIGLSVSGRQYSDSVDESIREPNGFMSLPLLRNTLSSFCI